MADFGLKAKAIKQPSDTSSFPWFSLFCRKKYIDNNHCSIGLTTRPSGLSLVEKKIAKDDFGNLPETYSSLSEVEDRIGDESIPYERPTEQATGSSSSGGKGKLPAIALGGVSIVTLVLMILGIQGVGPHFLKNIQLALDTVAMVRDIRNGSTISRVFSSTPGTTKIQKRLNKISNKTLARMARDGFVPYLDGQPMEIGKTGYPDVKPDSYRIDMMDGTFTDVPTDELGDFLTRRENFKVSRKAIGIGGFINPYSRTFVGRTIAHKLFSFYKVSRAGGILEQHKGSVDEKIKAFAEKHPRINKTKMGIDSIRSRVQEKMTKHSGKMKALGIAGLAAASYCIAVSIPRMATAEVASAELDTIVPIATETLLSPATAQLTAGGGSGFTSDDSEFLGRVFLEPTSQEDGTLSSAVESPYLLSAAGYSTGKLPVSEFAPGVDMLQNEFVQSGMRQEKATASGCSLLMNPVAMYAGYAVAFLTGGPVGLLAEIALDQAIDKITQWVAQGAVKMLIDAVNTSAEEKYDNLIGELLGDIVGVSARATFAVSGVGQYTGILSHSQYQEFKSTVAKREEFYKEMDIATLSPFDISSKYTFLGSIVNRLQRGMIQGGTYSNSNRVFSIISSFLKMPAIILTPQTAFAADDSDNYNHAGLLGYDENDPDAPSFDEAMMPRTGQTTDQLEMTVEHAEEVFMENGWINEDIDIKDQDTVEDMATSGFFTADTPVIDYIKECSYLGTATYVSSPEACMSLEAHTGNISADTQETYYEDYDMSGVNESPQGLATEDSLQAIPVLLGELESHNASFGLASETPLSNGQEGASASGNFNDVDPNGWSMPTDPAPTSSEYGYRSSPIDGTSELHNGLDIAAPGGSPVYAVRAGTAECLPEGSAGWSGFGNVVRIRHGQVTGVGDLSSFYAHLRGCAFTGIKEVSAGETIGYVGSTGMSTGDHLHFTMYKTGDPPTADDHLRNSMNPRDYHPGFASN